MGQVTARQIQEFEHDMVQNGYGGNTVSHTHVLLKTAFSSRTIPYGDELARVLEARACAMHDEREAIGLDWDEGLFVVGNAVTGAWKGPMALGQEWRAFVRVAKLVGSQGEPPRFHDLRYTFATMAIGSGVDVKTVRAIFGHSNAAMTLNVYADALADSKKVSMDLMGKIMSAGLS